MTTSDEERHRAPIFNIQRFSIQDGPGIRTTVFFKGCPLRCVWCSNPESQRSAPEVAHRQSLCVACGECAKACPQQAITFVPGEKGPRYLLDRTKCVACGTCVQACTAGALRIYGQVMTVEEVFDEIKRDADFYEKSEGGVTASGGECLLQADFVAALFRLCHGEGFHTTIDTCGYGTEKDLEKVLAETDLVLFDLKVMDSAEHEKLTKQHNEVILRNARLAATKSLPIIFRTPIIPGMTDSEKNLDAIARFVAGLDCDKRIDILPYHRFGEGKYTMLGRVYEMGNVAAPGDDEMRRILEVFKQYNIECEIQE
ncbi:MAG TPA: glycyl-radical enzyme activating protein [Syntrophorhabdaceae bacterium]|nr:glycyl-radical enzyme activating protein [Syntrophorhabdaceae bacterium]